MNKFLLSLFILISPMTVYSSWDFKVDQLFRSFPTGFYIKANGGYSYKFWEGEKDFAYGYLRPNLNLQTSAVVNVINPHLDFNPISFVNLFAGYSYTMRNISEISNFDCNQVICKADLNRKYYGARVALAYKNFLLLTGIKWTGVSLKDPTSQNFADEQSSTIASAGKDRLIQKTLLFGYQLNKKLLLGYLGQYNHMQNLKQKTKMHIALTRFTFSKNWELSAGPGLFQTRTDANNFTVLSLLTWKFKEAPILAH
ncbi:MAG: hypothetical protein CME70_03915 [Halobacteriovorax sp.]|nr:hypothetical protein [Halobacteriovorax sp.]